MSTYAKSSTNPMAATPDALRDELKALHDRGVAEEKERQFERAAETFRQAVELSRHCANPLVQLHCQWHHAMLLIELGRCRQGLHALGPLLTDKLHITPEQDDYLCDGMGLNRDKTDVIFFGGNTHAQTLLFAPPATGTVICSGLRRRAQQLRISSR